MRAESVKVYGALAGQVLISAGTYLARLIASMTLFAG